MLDGRQHQRPHFERATRTHDADGYDFEGPTRSEFTIHRGRTRAALNDWFGSGDIGGAVADISASADEPSGEFAYANAGYHVLCGVIEAATGTDVAAALKHTSTTRAASPRPTSPGRSQYRHRSCRATSIWTETAATTHTFQVA